MCTHHALVFNDLDDFEEYYVFCWRHLNLGVPDIFSQFSELMFEVITDCTDHQGDVPSLLHWRSSIWCCNTSFLVAFITWLCFPGVQMVKNLSVAQETWVWSLGGEDPLEKGTATHCSILAWRIHGQRSLQVHDWVTSTFTLHFRRFVKWFLSDFSTVNSLFSHFVLCVLETNY